MAWYRTGTVAVTNGSQIVTGTGTAFVANVQPGHAINLPDGRVYEVLSVQSDTQLTLGKNYLGATANGQTYEVQPNQGFAQIAAARLADFIAQFGTYVTTVLAGLFGDGTQGRPGIAFANDQDTGWRRVGDNALALVTGGVDRLTANADGSIGFGFRISLAVAQGVAPGILFNQAVTASWLLQNVAGANAMSLIDNQFGVSRQYWAGNGYVGFGTTAPISIVHASGSNATQVTVEATSGNGDTGFSVRTSARVWNFGQNIGGTGAGTFSLYDVTGGAPAWLVDTARNFRPGLDNSHALGQASYRWSVVYAGTGSINTSDERAKEQTDAAPDDWLDAWGDVEWVRYRFREAIAEKGEAARWHIGLVAQRVRDAFAARNIDALRIGLLCWDHWPATEPVEEERDEEGEIVIAAAPAQPAGDRWGLRYDECFAMEAAWQRRELGRLTARVAELQHG